MLRANRDATRQKDPKGFVVQTSSNEICRQLWKTRTDNFERKKKIYIYTVKNLKKFKNLIKIDVSVRDLHQLALAECFVYI